MSLLIESAAVADLGAIAQLESASFADPWPSYLFEEVLAHAEQHLYVAKMHSKVIGYVIFWKILDEVHILNICVDLEYRRKQVGERLIQTCLSHYEKQKISQFMLEVRRSNIAAQKLYAKFGFKQQHVRKNYYPNKEDAIIMSLVRC